MNNNQKKVAPIHINKIELLRTLHDIIINRADADVCPLAKEKLKKLLKEI